mmetsp:Transcript_115604/g.323253  ORF Transcript_115604/g.323253 Transcript_115604/m.323253 type:complete len:562 (+) Transcript_115604:495-2180(+)
MRLAGRPSAVVHDRPVPLGSDAVLLELLLEGEVGVQVVELLVVVRVRGEAGGEGKAILVVLHGELEGDGAAHNLLELVEEGLHVGEGPAAPVRAPCHELALRATELGEQQGNRKVLELVPDRGVGGVLEVVLAGLVRELLVAPRVDIEAVRVDRVVRALQLAREVPPHQLPIRRSHVHVGIDQRHAAHRRVAGRLVLVDVAGERLDAREGRIAVLVSHGHLVRHCEEQGVFVLAELPHDHLGAGENVRPDIAIAIQLLAVAQRRGGARGQPTPIMPSQGDDDVEAQGGGVVHEVLVRQLGVDVVQAHGVRAHDRDGVQRRLPRGGEVRGRGVRPVAQLLRRRNPRCAVAVLHQAPVVDHVAWVVGHAFREEPRPRLGVVHEVALDDDGVRAADFGRPRQGLLLLQRVLGVILILLAVGLLLGALVGLLRLFLLRLLLLEVLHLVAGHALGVVAVDAHTLRRRPAVRGPGVAGAAALRPRRHVGVAAPLRPPRGLARQAPDPHLQGVERARLVGATLVVDLEEPLGVVGRRLATREPQAGRGDDEELATSHLSHARVVKALI